MSIRVSVIIPVYNAENYIASCIRNLLQQTYNNIEIILIDDGSTDNSLSICKKFSRDNRNIRVLHTENRGSGPARNYGIDIATGEYAYFMDADDSLDQNAISILVSNMSNKDVDLIVFGFREVNKNGKVIREKTYLEKELYGKEIRENYEKHLHMYSEWGIQGAPWNKLFNLKKIKENNIRYPALRRHQDEVFISRYVAIVDKVKFIPNVLYNYYANDTKTEWKKYPNNYIDIISELKKYRLEILMGWNKNNSLLLEKIMAEHSTKVIKCMMLLFNPKYSLNKDGVQNEIKKIINRKEVIDSFENINDTRSLGIRVVKKHILAQDEVKLYYLIKFWIFTKERLGLFINALRVIKRKMGDG